jgi:hypothetical protein
MAHSSGDGPTEDTAFTFAPCEASFFTFAESPWVAASTKATSLASLNMSAGVLPPHAVDEWQDSENVASNPIKQARNMADFIGMGRTQWLCWRGACNCAELRRPGGSRPPRSVRRDSGWDSCLGLLLHSLFDFFDNFPIHTTWRRL